MNNDLPGGGSKSKLLSKHNTPVPDLDCSSEKVIRFNVDLPVNNSEIRCSIDDCTIGLFKFHPIWQTVNIKQQSILIKVHI